MTESRIEKKFTRELKALGCLVYKFVSPGNAGVPDRLVIYPDGTVAFIELKTEQGKASPAQEYQITKLRRQGVPCHILHGIGEVEEYLMDAREVLQR